MVQTVEVRDTETGELVTVEVRGNMTARGSDGCIIARREEEPVISPDNPLLEPYHAPTTSIVSGISEKRAKGVVLIASKNAPIE
jgi:hypothetical protein